MSVSTVPRTLRATLLLTLIASLAITGFAVAQSRSDKPVTLCARKSDGTLRLAQNGKCRKSETRLRVNQVGPAGAPGAAGTAGAQGRDGVPGRDGAAGRDATPADFAGEPTIAVAAAPAAQGQCAVVGQFCSGGAGWVWRNFGNGVQPVGFWKDRGGVVHLQGTAEQTSAGPGPRAAAIFVLPDGYRPAARRSFTVRGFVGPSGVLMNIDIDAEGRVRAVPGDGGAVPLDGISFRP